MTDTTPSKKGLSRRALLKGASAAAGLAAGVRLHAPASTWNSLTKLDIPGSESEDNPPSSRTPRTISFPRPAGLSGSRSSCWTFWWPSTPSRP